MSEIDHIETATAQYYIEDDILYVVFKEDADVDIEASKEGIIARKKLQQGKPMLVLVDTSKVWQITKESRAYSAREEVDAMNKAMAIVTKGSFVAKTAGNFFIKFNKPKTPTRLFTTTEKAVAWLNSFK